MDFAQTREIYARGKASGRRHMTAFTYRFVPAMNYIRHLVQTGALGAIRHARFQRLQDWGECAIGWRQYKSQAGSGELGDMGIHRLDFAEDLLGPIEAVCGAAKQLVPRDRTREGQPCPPQDVEDWIAWIAEFASGTTGVFEMGKLSQGLRPQGRPRLGRVQRGGCLGRLSPTRAARGAFCPSRRAVSEPTRAHRVSQAAQCAARSVCRRSSADLPLRPSVGIRQCHPRGARLRTLVLSRDASTGRCRLHPPSRGRAAVGRYSRLSGLGETFAGRGQC